MNRMSLGLSLGGRGLFGSSTLNQLIAIQAMFGSAQGAIYDTTDTTTMFQERTGGSATTPSGANGPIGSLKDLSPNNNWAVAVSDVTRPLSRQGVGVPNNYLEPDGIDDGLNVPSMTALLYIAASVSVPSGIPPLSTFSTVVFNGDNNSIRLDNASAQWRAPSTSTNSGDFSNGGSSTINGISGASFTFGVPHVFEMISGTAKMVGALLRQATAGRSGNMLTFRTVMISRVPSAGERAIIRKWLGQAAGLVI